MATANSKLQIDFGFDSRGTSNVNGDLYVSGSLNVQGNLSFSGTSVGDILPDQDQRFLGNTVSRWNLEGYAANIASTLTVAGITTLQEPVTLSKTLSSGNTTITGFANVTTSVNAASHTIGTILIANTTGIYHTGTINATNGFGSGTVNATSNGLVANTTVITTGNSSVNVSITPAGVTSSGGTGINPSSNTLGTPLGTSTQRWILNANTGNFSGDLTVSGTSTLTGNATLSGTLQTISGNSNFDNGTLFVDATNNRVGISNTSPTVAFEVTGAANVSTSVNSALLTVGSSFIANTTGAYHTGLVNAASLSTTGLLANTTALVPTSNTILLGNSTSRFVLSANTGSFSGAVSGITTLAAGNTTVTGFVNATSTIQGGSSLTIAGAASGITTLAAGNTTITGFANVSTSVNSSLLTVGTSFIANTTGAYHTGVIDAASYTSGTINATSNGFFAQATTLTVGNTSVNVSITPAGITSSGSTGVNPSSNTLGTALGTSTQRWILNANTGNFSGDVIIAGNTTVNNATLNGTLQTISGNVNFDTGVLFVDATNNRVGINGTTPTVAFEVTGAANVSTSVNSALLTVGTNFIANTTGVYHTGTINAASLSTTGLLANTTALVPTSNTILLGNSISRFVISANSGNFTGSVTFASTITANGTTGVAGQALLSNGATGSVYWGGAGAILADDTSTNGTRYMLFANQTSGALSNGYISSTKLTFNPSTGTLTSTIFSASSDQRLKNDIQTVDNPINTINQLRGVSFHRNGSNIKDYGVIAQELEQVLPSLVHHDSQGYKSVSYSSIIGILIEAIKEQQKQINHLLDQ